MSNTEWIRTEHVARLEAEFDTLVIGAGITGAGVALDLASRGLSVAVVDQADFAHGTSSRSTKLLHGGIRYLPHFEFHLVSEGLREQKVLARVADFLFDETEFVIPLYTQYGLADAPRWASGPRMGPLALAAGLTLYDILGGIGRPGHRHRRVTSEHLLEKMPHLATEGLRGGFIYSDAQTEDSRLVVSVAKTAVRRFGAVAAGGVRVERLTVDSPGYRVHMLDLPTGRPLVARARTVVSATGAFESPPLEGNTDRMPITRSKGVHVIVNGDSLGLGGRALVLPETDDGRVLYIVPWLGHAMIGTTDTPYEADPAHPVADTGDVEYLLRHVQRYLDVEKPEPLSTFAGLRALSGAGATSTARASREHVIDEPADGYVRVAGGKLTTYRRIAKQAGDLVAASIGLKQRSVTAETPLVGANGHVPSIERRLTAAGIEPEAARWMYGKYGTDSEQVARIAEATPALARSLSDGRTTLADVSHACRFEAAASIGDVALRRTRLAWFSPTHGRSDADSIADVMGEALGWDGSTSKRRIAEFEAELAAEGL